MTTYGYARVSTDQSADRSIPHARLMLTALGGLAEFERELMRELAGARGLHMGRPPTQSDLASGFAFSHSTISRLAGKVGPATAPVRRIDAKTELAARAFLGQIETRYSIHGAILFGSRARGDHTPDSDADIAVILKGQKGDRYKISGDMAGVEFQVLMKTGVMVQGVPLWEDEVARPETFSNPALIANILREGIYLD